MRLLIPVFSPATGTWGGLTRALAVADSARAAGHEVAFCAAGPIEAALRARGYPVYSVPPPTFLGLPPMLSRQLERRSQSAALPVRSGKSVGSLWLVLLVSGMAKASYLRLLVRSELRAVQEFGATALFTDLDVGAFITHKITGLPIATAFQAVMEQGVGHLPWRLVRRAANQTLAFFGRPACPPEQIMFGADVLKIIPSIPELDGTDPARADVLYVGHLLGDIQAAPAAPPDTARRYVLVYVGMGSIGLDQLRAVLPQVFPPDSTYHCLVGSQAVTVPESHGNVEFVPYVPFESLLPCTDWVIGHGGQNTIIQALRRDVPLILFPGPIFERRFNAAKVAENGAGLMGEREDCNPRWLADALRNPAPYAREAARLGAQIRAYPGAPAAIAALAARTPAG